MAQRGVQIDKRRKRETRDVELRTPHGGTVTVTPTRAEQLLTRAPIAFGDGTFRRYVEADSDESTEVELSAPGVTKAQPPRQGNKENTGDDA